MKKRYFWNWLLPALLAGPLGAAAQSVGIGTTTPNPKAALDISAADKGLLIPRMDSATRVAIGTPPDGLMVFQTDGRKGFWYAMSNAWLYIPDKTRSGDNLGNHTATQTFRLNTQRLTAAATTSLGDSVAQVDLTADISTASTALVARSKYYGTSYTRALLAGYGKLPDDPLTNDYGIWANAYRPRGWAGFFSAGNPGSPLRYVGLVQNPGSTNIGSAIRIVDGSQGTGKVLMSDALGYGTWQNPKANANFDLGPYFLVGNGGSVGLRISNTGNVGIGPDAPRGKLDVNGGGDSYLVANPATGSGQSVFLPGHLYLTPYNGSSGTAYVQARVPNPSASTSIGLTLRTTNVGNLVDALQLSANGDAAFGGTLDVDVETVSVNAVLGPASLSTLSVACPAGKRLIGGGGGQRNVTINNYSGVQILYSGVDDTTLSSNTWILRVVNTSNATRDLQVQCQCARVR